MHHMFSQANFCLHRVKTNWAEMGYFRDKTKNVESTELYHQVWFR